MNTVRTLVCLLAISAPIFAQNTFGQITGAVTVPSGTAIAGAKVTVTQYLGQWTVTSLTANSVHSTTLQPIPGTGSFGVISATRAGIFMRELQFALKLYF